MPSLWDAQPGGDTTTSTAPPQEAPSASAAGRSLWDPVPSTSPPQPQTVKRSTFVPEAPLNLPTEAEFDPATGKITYHDTTLLQPYPFEQAQPTFAQSAAALQPSGYAPRGPLGLAERVLAPFPRPPAPVPPTTYQGIGGALGAAGEAGLETAADIARGFNPLAIASEIAEAQQTAATEPERKGEIAARLGLQGALLAAPFHRGLSPLGEGAAPLPDWYKAEGSRAAPAPSAPPVPVAPEGPQPGAPGTRIGPGPVESLLLEEKKDPTLRFGEPGSAGAPAPEPGATGTKPANLGKPPELKVSPGGGQWNYLHEAQVKRINERAWDGTDGGTEPFDGEGRFKGATYDEIASELKEKVANSTRRVIHYDTLAQFADDIGAKKVGRPPMPPISAQAAPEAVKPPPPPLPEGQAAPPQSTENLLAANEKMAAQSIAQNIDRAADELPKYEAGGVKGEVYKAAAAQIKQTAGYFREAGEIVSKPPKEVIRGLTRTFGDEAPFVDHFRSMLRKERIEREGGISAVAEIADDLRPDPTIMQWAIRGDKGMPKEIGWLADRFPGATDRLSALSEKLGEIGEKLQSETVGEIGEKLGEIGEKLRSGMKREGWKGEDPMITLDHIRGRKITTPTIEAARKLWFEDLPGGHWAFRDKLKAKLAELTKAGAEDTPEALERIQSLERGIENLSHRDVGEGAGRVPLVTDPHVDDLSRLALPSMVDDFQTVLELNKRGIAGFTDEAISDSLGGYHGRLFYEKEAAKAERISAGGLRASQAPGKARLGNESPFLTEVSGQPYAVYVRRATQERNIINRHDLFEDMKAKGAMYDGRLIDAARNLRDGIRLSPQQQMAVKRVGGKDNLMEDIAQSARYTGEDPLVKWKRLPQNENLMQASDAFVPSYAHEAVAGAYREAEGAMDLADTVTRVLARMTGMRFWKTNKTALSSAVRLHVLAGRMALSHMGGMNMLNPQVWVKYVFGSVLKDPELMDRMRKAGTYVFGDNFPGYAEIEIPKEYYRESAFEHIKAIQGWMNFVDKATDAYSKLPVIRHLIKNFAWDENIFRRAGFKWAVDHGATDEMAAKWVNDTMVDYEDIPRVLRIMRRLPFPFTTFPVMVTAKSLIPQSTFGVIGGQGRRLLGPRRNPLSVGLPSGLPTGVGDALKTAAGTAGFGDFNHITNDMAKGIRFWSVAGGVYAVADAVRQHLMLSQGDVARINANKPEYAKRAVLFLIPWRDKWGNLQALDLTYDNPYGGPLDAVNIMRNSYNSPLDAAKMFLMTTPMAKTLAVAYTGVDPFNKRAIFNKLDPPTVQWQKLADWMYKEWAPPLAPELTTKTGAIGGAVLGGGLGYNMAGPPGAIVGSGLGAAGGALLGSYKPTGGFAWERLAAAARGIPERTTGRQQTLAPAIASALGAKIEPIPQGGQPRKREFKQAFREQAAYLQRHGIVGDEFNRRMKEYAQGVGR